MIKHSHQDFKSTLLERSRAMTTPRQDYMIVLSGLVAGLLTAGIALAHSLPDIEKTVSATAAVSVYGKRNAAFECKIGPDGKFDWEVSEPRFKASSNRRAFERQYTEVPSDITGSILKRERAELPAARSATVKPDSGTPSLEKPGLPFNLAQNPNIGNLASESGSCDTVGGLSSSSGSVLGS
ncbi:MAG: hypothetical protein ACKVON_00520 [Beijerinckiaceae bacterium]